MFFTKTIETASKLKAEFAEYNRDDYKIATYEGILQFIADCYEEPQELDVIAWCCGLTEMTYEETYNYYPDCESKVKEYCEDNEVESDFTNSDIINVIAEYISENTIVLAQEEDFISFLAF